MVSSKALQIGNSFSCQICVIGFLSGVCLTSLLLSAITSSFRFYPNSTSNFLYSKPERNMIEVGVGSIYSAWSVMLNRSNTGESLFSGNLETVHRPPHLENCKLKNEANQVLDKREENGRLPPWSIWKGFLSNYTRNGHQVVSDSACPPWVDAKGRFVKLYVNEDAEDRGS